MHTIEHSESISNYKVTMYCTVVDPGFPTGKASTYEYGAQTYYLQKFCQKLNENERIQEVGAHPWCPWIHHCCTWYIGSTPSDFVWFLAHLDPVMIDRDPATWSVKHKRQVVPANRLARRDVVVTVGQNHLVTEKYSCQCIADCSG